MMLELYGQALSACVWHTNPQKHLEHPDLLTKYGAVTDLRTIVRGNLVGKSLVSATKGAAKPNEDRLVAANGSETKGRCFTMAPAMMAFFRIMLSYNCVVPVYVTGESFEHAILHYVCAALRSCAGRTVRDFLSLIVTDADTTIPEGNPGNTLTIPSNINKKLLVLSLGHRKFDQNRLKWATASQLPTDPEEAKEARATKEVVDLAFTVEEDAKAKTRTLNAKWPVVLLNGSNAHAADIIVIVPGVMVCHVQCKDYLSDKKLTEKDKSGNVTFVTEYETMTQPLDLAPSPQYYVIATTSPDRTLEKKIKERNMALLVLRVPRTINPAKTTTRTTLSPRDEKSSGCAFRSFSRS